MYVRTTYVTGDPAKVDSVADAISSEGRRLLSEQPGYRGMGVFVDRELGKLVAGSWWDDEKSRQDSDDTGRNTGPLVMPSGETLEATGNDVRVRGCDIATVEDGKIVSYRLYFDQLDFLGQLGLLGEAPA